MNIIVRKLEKVYDRKTVLSIENLNFRENTITALVGKNGTGKSTFLNIIAGLDLEYSGHMLYNNIKLNKKIMRDITLVSQKPYMLNRTVSENLSYPLKIRKINKEIISKKVDDILEKFNIENLKNRNATTLSGGEKQKVAIARAMIFEPKILLLDEVTSNIDSNTTIDIENIVLNYRRELKANIVLVTHDKNQINKLGENIIKLD